MVLSTSHKNSNKVKALSWEVSLNCGLLYGLALVNDKLYVASPDDNEGSYVVNFQDGTSEKVARNGNECPRSITLRCAKTA